MGACLQRDIPILKRAPKALAVFEKVNSSAIDEAIKGQKLRGLSLYGLHSPRKWCGVARWKRKVSWSLWLAVSLWNSKSILYHFGRKDDNDFRYVRRCYEFDICRPIRKQRVMRKGVMQDNLRDLIIDDAEQQTNQRNRLYRVTDNAKQGIKEEKQRMPNTVSRKGKDSIP